MRTAKIGPDLRLSGLKLVLLWLSDRRVSSLSPELILVGHLCTSATFRFRFVKYDSLN